MAKFALECPKCGSLNTASTFILSKKVIQCGHCGEEINVKTSRMTSKKCPNPNCGKIIVCDQAKLKGKVCSSCGTPLENSATAEYKITEIVCPQCNCQIEVDKTKDTAYCPICDMGINIKEAIAKSNIVKDGGISVIKYEGDNSTFVWKHPIEDFNMGSQLIVHESQEAIFFFNGEALDSFGPGRYTLQTENLPVLKKAFNISTGMQSPFHAEVYFINKTVQMGIKWGTDSRVRFIEPNTGIPLDIGASGEMNLQVLNARQLLFKLVGTTGGLSRDQILSVSGGSSDLYNESSEYNNNRNIYADKKNSGWSQIIKGLFKPMIMTTVKANLASAIKTQKLNILEIDEQLEVLSESLRKKVTVAFEEYGLCVPQFYVTNVSLPEDDKNFKKIRELLASSYLGIREAEVKADIVAAQRKIEVEKEATLTELAKSKAERTRIDAQAEADRLRYEGFAEAEVMAAKGYSQKDVIQAEVQKAYAEGIGNLGGNGATGGGIMSDVLGLGIGMAAVGNVSDKMNNIMKNFSDGQEKVERDDNSGWTCSCGNVGNSGKFCSECGKEKPKLWICTYCGAKGNSGKFCSECGKEKQELWECLHCGVKGNSGKFCSECGKPKEKIESWDCLCGNKGITGKFCSECGNKKENIDNE